MNFKYLSKHNERIIYDKGIEKRYDTTGSLIVNNLHETNWTEWNNYKYDQKVFESHRVWDNGKIRYMYTLKGQKARMFNYLKKSKDKNKVMVFLNRILNYAQRTNKYAS